MKDRNLFQGHLFSVSFREYVTLIVCVLISVLLLFNSNTPQVERMRATIIGVSAGLLTVFSEATPAGNNLDEIERLRGRTTELMLENSRLRAAIIENQRLRRMLDLEEQSPFEMVAGKVIAVGWSDRVRSVTVNVGSESGVERNMPVLSTDGLCGKVFLVTPRTSIVQLLVDHNFRVACRVERSRVDGILSYEDGRHFYLKEVPKHADIRTGDVLVTSGLGRIFPPNIRVGVVELAEEATNSMFKLIQVQPSVDFYRLEEVFIITSPRFESESESQ